MTRVGTQAVRELASKLQSETGLRFALARLQENEALPLGSLEPARVVETNAGSELLEKRAGASYPSVHVYCERIENKQIEKFRSFSGTVSMAADVRVSDDRIETVETNLRLQVEAITHVLDLNRGTWGGGAFYSGGYSVDFEPIRHGGRHYLQTAKIRFVLQVSVN
jgi:hypothetical protein